MPIVKQSPPMPMLVHIAAILGLLKNNMAPSFCVAIRFEMCFKT